MTKKKIVFYGLLLAAVSALLALLVISLAAKFLDNSAQKSVEQGQADRLNATVDLFEQNAQQEAEARKLSAEAALALPKAATPVEQADAPTPVGDQPGLGSDGFVMSDRTFLFPSELHVEYRRSEATMMSGNKYGKTTEWRTVKNPVCYAYDPKMMDAGIPITGIQVNGEWFTPYGGGHFVYKSTGGYDIWSVCMDEQACADFRTHKKKGSKAQLEAAVKHMVATTGEINSAEYCKRHKCQKDLKKQN